MFWSRFLLSDLPNLSDPKDPTLRLDVLLNLPGIAWEAMFSPPAPGIESGLKYLSERVGVIVPALGILVSALAFGRLLLRSLGLISQLKPVERFGISAGAGLSVVSLLTLGLGWFGLLSRGLFFVALGLPILFEAYFLLRNSERNGSESTGSKNTSSQTITMGILAFLLMAVPFLVLIVLGAMLPSTDFDVKEYHLQGPKEYFLAGRVQFLPHNVYTSFPFLTEMLSLCGMVVKNDWATGGLVGKTVLAAFAPITACGVFAVGKRFSGSWAGAIGAVCYLSTPWVFRISTIAYTEGALCCYVVLTFLVFLKWLDWTKSEEREAVLGERWACLVGFLAGSAISTKYPGLVLVAIPFAIAIGVVTFLRMRSLNLLFRHAGWFSLGVAVSFGPWALKNTVETGNPVYPLVYSVFGGTDWGEQLDEKWKHAHGRPSALIKSPSLMVSELKANAIDVTIRNDWQSPLLFGLAPLALLFCYRRSGIWLTFGYLVWILLTWYTLTHLLDRFWVPVLPIAAILAGIAGHELCVRFSSRRLPESALGQVIQRFGVSCLCIIFVGTLVFNLVFVTAGLAGNNAFLTSYRSMQQLTHSVPMAIRIAEEFVGPDDNVLFVGEAQVFDADFDFQYNTVFDRNLLLLLTTKNAETVPSESIASDSEEWDLLPAEEIRERFSQEGLTHVLVNWNEILRYRTTYGYTDFVSPQRIQQLVDAGVLQEITLPPQVTLRNWDALNDSYQAEVEKWGPELKSTGLDGVSRVKLYQLFKVRDDESL